MTDYIACFKVVLNCCSIFNNIEAKFLFAENLWAKVSIQVMNAQPIILKDS